MRILFCTLVILEVRRSAPDTESIFVLIVNPYCTYGGRDGNNAWPVETSRITSHNSTVHVILRLQNYGWRGSNTVLGKNDTWVLACGSHEAFEID
jgi:hypothetical protein